MSIRRLNALVWFGVLGGPVAWGAQFVLGMELTYARCESPDGRFPIPVHATSIALAAAGVALGLLAEAVAFAVFRATRGDERLSMRRIHFLATVGLTVNPLALIIAAMAGVGVPLLAICNQS